MELGVIWRKRACAVARVLLMGLAAGACHDPEPTLGVTRVRSTPDGPELHKGPEERFSMAGRGGGGAQGGERDIASFFRWEVPDGWETRPAQPLRLINLAAGEVECYVSQVSGNQSSSNLNRWRGQMGAEPLSEAAIEELLVTELFGRPAYRMDVDGAYQGMSGTSWPDARMLTVYADFPAFALTVKMIGPREAVLAQAAAFAQFTASLGFNVGDGAEGQDEHAGHDHGDEPHPTGAAGTGAPSSENLAWDEPPGWQRGAPKTMRYVTYVPAGQPEVECYITLLQGDGGGLMANLNRWVRQIGNPSLSEGDVRALPRIELLGSEVALLESYGMDGGVLGTMIPLRGEVMFIKMIGPETGLRAERENFIAFCGSLRNG